MIGTGNLRKQGLDDPLLVKVMRDFGLDEIPLWKHRPPETISLMDRWKALAKYRDGSVNPQRADVSDVAATTTEIKRLAREWGADLVGCTKLMPTMIERNHSLPHRNVIAIGVHEDYAKVIDGPRQIELEAMKVYVSCAEISTRLAAHIRDMGFPALAHHNGAGEIWAIPTMYAAGFGELGKHGSLIHPVYGASFRPGFVTTDLPIAPDVALEFGVQDYCLHCRLCTNNCPGKAIPEKFEITEGVRRWITDVEKCYPYSRLRDEYCHICVDVCPYIHKENDSPIKRQIYKRYMMVRKQAGFDAPTWFPEEPEPDEDQ